MGVDISSVYRQAFRVADMLRYCGGDVYHRDFGWWDRIGDWNGPDWRSVNEYLKKYDMVDDTYRSEKPYYPKYRYL